MARKMLIDASHAEELRVVVCTDGEIEEFDYQNNVKKSTKGDIHLAKVTRVEPSLQAAFIDFGGQRHGFLPFAEIHPIYYQIPVSDKEQLIAEMSKARKIQEETETKTEEASSDRTIKSDENITEGDDIEETEEVGNISSENDFEYDASDRPQFYRRYRIQEVIKRDQVILVQIEKEERGNKGASFTTYISLAGRYCVLMSNATKGGGVSRKINDEYDRNRLKKIASELTSDNDGQGAVIIRTAGAYKTKAEIKRDYQYLVRLWNNIREHTLKAHAPAFIHEEGDVIKRAIRDLYDNDIEEILIEGSSVYESTRDFMKLLLPRHVNKVKLYDDKLPLYSKYGVEEQIAELYSNHVHLRSGGYLVINQTEALVAIDVNSGKATRERNVESTAVRTNREAARVIAEQLRRRDLYGLIVIDFIDMEDVNNRKEIERELKHAMAKDKAKVQIGRISNFGLLEMSRQRLNQSLIEASTEVCSHCDGRGRIRHPSSTAIAILRAIECETANLASGEILVSGSLPLILNIMNNKRERISKIEEKFGGKITFYVDESAGGDGFFIEKKAVSYKQAEKAPSGIDKAIYMDDIDVGNIDNAEEEEEIITPEMMPNNTSRNRKPSKKKIRHKFRHTNNEAIVSAPQDNGNNQGHIDEEFDNFNDGFSPDKQNKERNADSQDDDTLGSERSAFKKRRNKRTKAFKKTEDTTHGGSNSEKSNDHYQKDEVSEMDPSQLAEIRKKNQSLLKEIWRKIVD